MPSQPKIRAAWYFVDRDVAQVSRDSDDLTVPTVSEVHTLADAHEAARGRPPMTIPARSKIQNRICVSVVTFLTYIQYMYLYMTFISIYIIFIFVG